MQKYEEHKYLNAMGKAAVAEVEGKQVKYVF